MSKRPDKGFTIIELMVVVAVMGIMATVALPAFNQMVQNNRRVAAVNDFLASLHIARSEAITRGQSTSVCRSNAARTACAGIAGPWQNGWLVFTDENRDGIVNGADQILSTGGPLRGALAIRSDHVPTYMTFLPNGRVTNTGEVPAFMMLCDGDADEASRIFIVDFTGRPRVATEHTDGEAGACPS